MVKKRRNKPAPPRGKMTPNPDSRCRQTFAGSAAEQSAAFVCIRGGNWQKPKPDSTAKRRLLPAPTPPMSAVSARNRSSTARCPMQTNARAVGQICPASGRKKSRHRQNRAARHSRRDPKSAPTAHRRKSNCAQCDDPSADADPRQVQLAIQKPSQTPARRLLQCARQFGIFLPICTA